MEDKGGRERDISDFIDATGVHAGVHVGVQIRCGLSTLLSKSLGKLRGLFLMIISVTIQDVFTYFLFIGSNGEISDLSLGFGRNCGGTPSRWFII